MLCPLNFQLEQLEGHKIDICMLLCFMLKDIFKRHLLLECDEGWSDETPALL